MDLGSVLLLLLSALGLLSLLLLLSNHALHAVRELKLHIIVFSMGLHESLQVSGSFLEFLLDLEGVCAPVKCLLIGCIEMVDDIGAIGGDT